MTPNDGMDPQRAMIAQENVIPGDDTGDSDLTSLCRDCRAIDWFGSGFWNRPLGELKILRFWGYPDRAQLLASSCRLCRLGAQLANPDTTGLDRFSMFKNRNAYVKGYQLESHGKAQGWFTGDERSPVIKLAIRSPPTGMTQLNGHGKDYVRFLVGHKFSKSEMVNIHTLHPSLVRFDRFEKELELCCRDHQWCRSPEERATQLRVIDVCSPTRAIIQAKPDCQYAALSYVWGDDFPDSGSAQSFPPVVQDAISVTKALVCRYLWVDRHCIDQSSSGRMMMIQQMDLIYANAYVTIIAASGSSAQEGLPGVSRLRRHPQARTRIGDTNFIEISTTGSYTIRQSMWATRGWTYQEGYLSNRRLIFTETEVLFLCNHKLVRELQVGHVVDPYHIINIEEIVPGEYKTYGTDFRHQFQWMLPPDGDSAYWPLYKYFESHIAEYSSRLLSRDSDSLDALLGIFKHYESNTKDKLGPVSHLWGIPIKLVTLDSGIGVYFDLLWYRQNPSYRRRELPSWSWSGWRGPIYFMELKQYPMVILSPPVKEDVQNDTAFGDNTIERILRICVRSENITIDLCRFIQDRKLSRVRGLYADCNADSKRLSITSFVVQLRFRELCTYPGTQDSDWSCPSEWGVQASKVFSIFPINSGLSLGVSVRFDRAYDPEVHYLGLVLPSSGKFYEATDRYHIIVLKQIVDGQYERAGIVSLFYNADTGWLLSGFWYKGAKEVTLDERDDVVKKQYSDRNGPGEEYLFLRGSQWRTIDLV